MKNYDAHWCPTLHLSLSISGCRAAVSLGRPRSYYKLPEILLQTLHHTSHHSLLTSSETPASNLDCAEKPHGLLLFSGPSTSQIEWNRNSDWQQLLNAKWILLSHLLSSLIFTVEWRRKYSIALRGNTWITNKEFFFTYLQRKCSKTLKHCHVAYLCLLKTWWIIWLKPLSTVLAVYESLLSFLNGIIIFYLTITKFHGKSKSNNAHTSQHFPVSLSCLWLSASSITGSSFKLSS